MKNTDIAITLYNSARSEINTRLHLRDQALFLYMAIIGALFGLALGTDKVVEEILLSVPFLGLGISVLVYMHDVSIGALARYCSTEIFSSDELKSDVVVWDLSESFLKLEKKLTASRFFSHTLVIVPPVIASMIYSFHLNNNEKLFIVIIWWLGFLSTLINLIILASSFTDRYRSEQSRKTKEKSKSNRFKYK